MPSAHWQTDVPDIGSEPNPDDVATQLWASIGNEFRAVSSATLTVHELVVTEEVLKPSIGVVGAHTVGLAGLVAVGTDVLPAACVPLINIHTQTHSRSARGWQFLGSTMNAAELSTAGVWETTFLANLQLYADRLAANVGIGDINITTAKPVIYSRTRHQRGQTPYVFSVSNAKANPAPTWLRSRRTSP